MVRTSINKLKDYLRGSSAILGNPDFIKLLDVSAPKGSSGDRVFAKILQLALNEYEKLQPIYLYCTLPPNDDGLYVFEDNFGAYLAGDIDEDYIQLVPTSVAVSGDSWVHQYRNYTYSAPVLNMLGQPYNNQIMYTARRPVLLTYSPDSKRITDDSYIYFIDVDGRDADRWLLMYIELEILRYLRDQKANIMYPDLPIDFLSGLPERYNEVFQLIENYRINPYKNAEILR